MRNLKVLSLPGDGIGQEVTASAGLILKKVAQDEKCQIEVLEGLIGGAAIDALGDPLPQQTLDLAKECDAILLGGVGGPKWDHLPTEQKPEKGLLRIRQELDLFANLRPALLFPSLVSASSLKPDLVENLDILILRELTGGIYFGEPRGVELRNNERVGFNTLVYSETEIDRIGRVAFELAQKRNHRLCSVDKANVLEVSQLWREVLNDIASDYPDVELSHMYVDNAAMQLVREPKQFDVIVTGNMFGDILSDVAAMLTGSLGMLPSASIATSGLGLYEPVHGTAPDIAGQDLANPLATILSVAMMCKYSLDLPHSSLAIEEAVSKVLEEGFRTGDILSDSEQQTVGCARMAELVLERL
jgi:3-isopropylmalate dehydrogenase